MYKKKRISGRVRGRKNSQGAAHRSPSPGWLAGLAAGCWLAGGRGWLRLARGWPAGLFQAALVRLANVKTMQNHCIYCYFAVSRPNVRGRKNSEPTINPLPQLAGWLAGLAAGCWLARGRGCLTGRPASLAFFRAVSGNWYLWPTAIC